MFDFNSAVLYILVIILSTFFAAISQSSVLVSKDRMLCYRENYIGWYCISFFILAFFSSCSSVGVDRESYAQLFKISSFSNPYEFFEPGFNLLIGITKLFTDNAQIFLMTVSFLTVAFTFKGIWDFRNDISLGWAVFIYSSQYYLQGFNLMRIYLAMSILILGAKWLKDEEFLKYVIITLIASTIHYSMFFATIAITISWIMHKKCRVDFDTKLIIVFSVASFFSLFAYQILTFVVGKVDIFSNKYAMYIEEMSSPDIGFKLIFNLVPFILMILLAKATQNRICLSVASGYLFATLVVSILSYSIPMVGRALLCFHMPIIIFLPLLMESMQKQKKVYNKSIVEFSIFNLGFKVSNMSIKNILIGYFIMALLLYLYLYMGIDGITDYELFWK